MQPDISLHLNIQGAWLESLAGVRVQVRTLTPAADSETTGPGCEPATGEGPYEVRGRKLGRRETVLS